VVRGHDGTNWGTTWTGTAALGLTGTESALQACAQLAEEYAAEPKICEPLLGGLHRAIASSPWADWYYLAPPPWAAGLSPAEARPIVAPLAQALKGVVPERCKDDLAAILGQVTPAEAG
jgi:hypothetical protein